MSKKVYPGVDKCATCPNMMRPYNAKVAHFPGTHTRTGGGICAACRRVIDAAGRPAPTPKPIPVRVHDPNPTPATLAGLAGFMRQRNQRLARLNRKATK